MDRLTELAKELGSTGLEKLWRGARSRNIPVTRQQIKEFLSTKGEAQVFRPLPKSAGKTAAEGPGTRFQMDLIDMKNSKSNGMSVILVLVDVFTRQAWAKGATSKNPERVEQALRPLLNDLPSMPDVIFSDAGNEFSGAVSRLLEEKGIVHQTRSDKFDVNVLAVIDRIVQNLKLRLAKRIAADGGEWGDPGMLKAVTDGYNKTDHSAVNGEPKDVATNPVQKFLTLQDNAGKAAHNQELLEKRTKTLERTMAFRRPKGGLGHFKRGFKAAYGDVERATAIDGSKVRTARGGTADIKRVQPVNENSSFVDPTFAEWSERDERKRAKVLELIDRIQQRLGTSEISMVKLATFLKSHYGEDRYRALLDSVHFKNLSDVLKLFPGSVEMTRSGYYVKNA